jgi:hypothetical protein
LSFILHFLIVNFFSLFSFIHWNSEIFLVNRLLYENKGNIDDYKS